MKKDVVEDFLKVLDCEKKLKKVARELILTGMSMKEIAIFLGFHDKTVHLYSSMIYENYEVHGRAELQAMFSKFVLDELALLENVLSNIKNEYETEGNKRKLFGN